MKTFIRRIAIVLSLLCVFSFVSPVFAYATSLDELTGDTAQGEGNVGSSSNDKAISDYLRGTTPVTQENMKKASSFGSPLVNAIGTISGFVIMIVSAGIFLVTALDLCYIGLPFTRQTLNPNMGAGGGASPMGGMGMGMGMRGMGMGGMGASPAGVSGRRTWVSDEAIACVAMAGGTAPAGGGMGGMGMGGMGMGMGMGMGGMGAMGGAQQQPQNTKSVIFSYLKKRAFFIIIFSVATVILMSSVLTDCGLNLADLLQKILNKFNGQIASVNI